MQSVFNSEESEQLNCYSTEKNICEAVDYCTKLEQEEAKRQYHKLRYHNIVLYQSHIIFCIIVLIIIISIIAVFWTWGDSTLINGIVTVLLGVLAVIILAFIIWSVTVLLEFW